MWGAGFDGAKVGLLSVDDNELQSIWEDESILHPMSKDMNSASILALDTEKLLLAGFDEPEGAADDFFELLGKIDAKREKRHLMTRASLRIILPLWIKGTDWLARVARTLICQLESHS